MTLAPNGTTNKGGLCLFAELILPGLEPVTEACYRHGWGRSSGSGPEPKRRVVFGSQPKGEAAAATIIIIIIIIACERWKPPGRVFA